MLTNGQKAYLAQLAKRAFDKCASSLVGGPDDGISAEDWRRREVGKACGKFGLRCCGQTDYKLVEAHFLRLLGETRRADKAYIRAATEPKRQAEAVLVRELARFNFRPEYAERICLSKFKCTVCELQGANQVWVIVYDIRRNGARKMKQLKEVAS